MKRTYLASLYAVLVFLLTTSPLLHVGVPSSVLNAEDDVLQGKVLSTEDEALSEIFKKDVLGILQSHCIACHGEHDQEAGLRFDKLDPSMPSNNDVMVWSSIRDVLNSYQMPPEQELQPSERERRQILEWIEKAFEQVALRQRKHRASSIRRLTVTEYENTLQEFFGARVPFGESLPAAPLSQHGYSRDATLLGVSALELEYFLSIARRSVDDYVMFGDRIPDREHFLIEVEDVKFRPGVSGGYSIAEPLTDQELLERKRARQSGHVVFSERTLFPLPEGPLEMDSEELNRSDRQKFHEQFAKFKSRQLHKTGELIARVHVAAKLGDDGSSPRLQFKINDTLGMEFGDAVGGERDVIAPKDQPQIHTFRIPFRHIPGNAAEERLDDQDDDDHETTLTLSVTNVSHHRDAVFDVVPEGYNFSAGRSGLMARYRKTLADSIVSKASMRSAGVNELYLDAIEIEIVPFGLDVNANLWRVDAQRAVLNAGADSRAVAKESLQAFMNRAYRRSIAPVELESMLSLYDRFTSEGDSFEEALKETFATILISDPFLYINAPISPEVQGAISKEEGSQFASRLSYFLWSGAPDDRLRDLAARDQLSDPAVLAAEVSRMLDDQRARRFSHRFAREWLRLDKYDLVAVNPEFYPYYDDDLGKDLVAETVSTFQGIFHGDRDARELISSETVYVN